VPRLETVDINVCYEKISPVEHIVSKCVYVDQPYEKLVLYDVERQVDVTFDKVTEKVRPVARDTNVPRKVIIKDEVVRFVDGRTNEVS